jgi:dihydrolipoamide dehydrogenase
MAETCDLVVLGGGPAGYVPAIRAAQMGKSVTLVERDLIGGTCLNRGCIPTKTLVATAALYSRSLSAARFGLQGSLDFDYSQVSKRKDAVVTRLRKGIEAHFAHLGINVVRGHGTLVSGDTVSVEGKAIKAGNILLAPGSRPLIPGFLSHEGVLTSTDILTMEYLPESLLIIGGGVIGCEFASILSTFKVKVTIVEMLPKILPGVDADVAAVVERSLKKSRVSIHTGAGASSVKVEEGSASVTLEDGTVLAAEKILASIGRKSSTEGSGFSEAGVELDDRGNIVTDDNGMTTLEGVYAAGDATGKWQLAHAGSAQGIAAVHHMFGGGVRKLDPEAMSGCIFTSPEIAMVGPGEDELRQRGVAVRTSTARYIANGKATGMNETEGFIKIVAGEGGIIRGVQIAGADASSLVGWAVMAVNAGIKVEDAASFVHPHPTLSELFWEASEGFGYGSIHG